MQRYLYVVFSSTPYKMGKFIRFFTRNPYNHVSISLDPRLQTLYAFARRFYRTPFYGGFVIENPSRYRLGSKVSQVKLCKVPISQESYDKLSAQLSAMSAQKEHYLYNHFSALGSCIKKKIKVRDAYICIEFCMEALQIAGLDVDPERYYSIRQAEELLAAYVVYTGPFSQEADEDLDYFSRKPVPHPILSSIRSVFALFPRLEKSK